MSSTIDIFRIRRIDNERHSTALELGYAETRLISNALLAYSKDHPKATELYRQFTQLAGLMHAECFFGFDTEHGYKLLKRQGYVDSIKEADLGAAE